MSIKLTNILLIISFYCLILHTNILKVKADDGIIIYLSINAKNHSLEINWLNGSPNETTRTLLITNKAVIKVNLTEYNFTYNDQIIFNKRWTIDDNRTEILVQTPLNGKEGRIGTEIVFDYDELRDLDFTTKCYNYWFYYVDYQSKVINEGCMEAHPKWMNEIRDVIKNYRFRSLFIPGTHDSASFRYNFKPTMETIVSKYTLTQDDDIRSQLIHGIRYIDLRVGYYRSTDVKFWVNHGISRLHPLIDVLHQVKDFVQATDEIVILDFQEFPVGFKRDMSVHRMLAMFLLNELGDVCADPGLTWDASLNDIWLQGKQIIVAYDHFELVKEFGHNILWRSVRQRWGQCQTLPTLEKFLRDSRRNMTNDFGSRPFAEMAELTPLPFDVFTDKHGGLRSMADKVNFPITKLYYDNMGQSANIVAVDFYKSTNIVNQAIHFNKQKLPKEY